MDGGAARRLERGRPRLDDRARTAQFRGTPGSRTAGGRMSGPEIITFGCRLNSFESEIIRDHARAQGWMTWSWCTPARSPPKPSARRARRSARPARPARCAHRGHRVQRADQARGLRGDGRGRSGRSAITTSSTPPVARARRPAAGRGARHHDGARDGRASGRRVRWPRARVRPGAAGVRSPLHLLHHSLRPRPEPERAGGRGGRADAPPGRRRLPRGRADRGRSDLLRQGSAGPADLGQLVRRLLRLVPELPRLRLSSIDPAEVDRDLVDLVATSLA